MFSHATKSMPAAPCDWSGYASPTNCTGERGRGGCLVGRQAGRHADPPVGGEMSPDWEKPSGC